MDKQLRDAIELKRAEKAANAKRSRAQAEADEKRKDAALNRAVRAAMPKAREYVRSVLIPKIAEEAVNGGTEIRLGSLMDGLPVKPKEALVKAIREVDGLRAESGYHQGGYEEGFGYDNYDFVRITWTNP